MSNSAVVKSVDRRAVEDAVLAYARNLFRSRREVETVIWFGSWIGGTAGPGSDIDLCLVLRRSGKKFRNRIPDYLPGGFPACIDLFPYTKEEFDRLAETHPEMYRAINSGRVFHAGARGRRRKTGRL